MTPTETSAGPIRGAHGLPHRRFQPGVGGSRVSGRIPTGLFGMLVLVAAVEVAVARGGTRFLDPVAFGWAFSARVSTEKAPGRDVLCLGDSLVKHGLAPRVISEVTGRRAYNLSAPGSPAPMTYFLLRRALDAGARPSAVVFDLKPSLLVGGPKHYVQCFSRVLAASETLDLCLTERNGSFAAELVLQSLLGSFRSRHEIRDDLLAALRGETSPTRALNAVCDRNWTVNDGVNIATPRPGYAGEVSEAEHHQLVSRGFNAHRVNTAYARRLLALAAGRGIPAYLVLPPLAPRVAERRGQTGAEGKYTAFVESLQARFPGLTVLDARDSGYPPSAFVDPIHLDARGALALSRDVSAVLRDDLDRPDEPRPPKRWVRLPPYRERPIPADLEDVERSREELKKARNG